MTTIATVPAIVRDRVGPGPAIDLSAAATTSWAVFAVQRVESGDAIVVADRHSAIDAEKLVLAGDDPATRAAEEALSLTSLLIWGASKPSRGPHARSELSPPEGRSARTPTPPGIGKYQSAMKRTTERNPR